MFNVETGAFLSGMRLNNIIDFLSANGLSYEGGADFTVSLTDYDGNIVGTGSLCKNVLKYIAVSPEEQGSGAAAVIVSELISHACREGIFKLYMFTKPQNASLFCSMGFYELARTNETMMLENTKNGLESFLASLEKPQSCGKIGAVVANCNPITNGHLYLIKAAASKCDALHLFILSENKSLFSTQERYTLAKQATEGIDNLYVHPGSDYIISSATFPAYFMKGKSDPARINADLDLTLFAKRIAPALDISVRFVGTEPFCAVTNAYNERMKKILPEHGIEVVELERFDNISASNVRKLIELRRFDEIKQIVPQTTYDYIISKYADKAV